MGRSTGINPGLRGPGANFQVHEESHVEDALRQILTDLGAEAGTKTFGAFDVICVGMAGIDRPVDRDGVLGVLERLGVRCLTRIENDAFIALVAGSSERIGIVLVAGTGSVAYGVDGSGEIARASGWGYLLADEGSGARIMPITVEPALGAIRLGLDIL